jgi:hypothetical protein
MQRMEKSFLEQKEVCSFEVQDYSQRSTLYWNFHSLATKNIVWGSTALTSSRNLLEMQNSRPHPRPLNQKLHFDVISWGQEQGGFGTAP